MADAKVLEAFGVIRTGSSPVSGTNCPCLRTCFLLLSSFMSSTPFLDRLSRIHGLVREARAFAREAHDSIAHIRKGSGLPYWTHTEAVAEIIAVISGDLELVVAALLHDVLEDVADKRPEYGPRTISRRFGLRVLGYVLELSDVYLPGAYPGLNRRERKRMEAHRLATVSAGAKKIKLADVADNTERVEDLSDTFRPIYVAEIHELWPLLVDGSPEGLRIRDIVQAHLKRAGIEQDSGALVA